MAFLIGSILYRSADGYIRFPTNAKTKFRSVPEKDSTGRTIKWTTCTLTVECYITAGDIYPNQPTVDADFALMRRVLESPGGVLQINNKGVGNLNNFNVDTSALGDVNWGPFPKVLEWEPLGNVSCYVMWEVEYSYLNSYWAAFDGLVEFSWSSKFSLNEDGATIRTISGHLLLAGKRMMPAWRYMSPRSNADTSRDIINIECPIGFVRDRQDWDVSEAKNRIDFTIIDRQLPHEAYPIGITDMDCDFDLDTTTDRGIFTRFVFSFTGSAKAALNFPKSSALKALREEHNFRFEMILAQLKSSHGSIIPLPARFRIREKTKGQDARRVHLSIAWILTVLPSEAGSYFPKDILARCGFFKQNNKNDPVAWRNAMSQPGGPLTQRGHALLSVESDESEIFDLRSRGKLPNIGGGRKGFIPLGSAADTLPFAQPTGSYHDYKNSLEAHTITGTILPIPIEQADDKVKARVVMDTDRVKLKMSGHATRYNVRPVIPELTKVNGIAVDLIGIPVTKQDDVKNLNGVAIYRAEWVKWYELVQDKKNAVPSGTAIENPANPSPQTATKPPQNVDVPPVVVGND